MTCCFISSPLLVRNVAMPLTCESALKRLCKRLLSGSRMASSSTPTQHRVCIRQTSDIPHSDDLQQLTANDIQQAQHAENTYLQFGVVVADNLQVATFGLLDQPLRVLQTIYHVLTMCDICRPHKSDGICGERPGCVNAHPGHDFCLLGQQT